MTTLIAEVQAERLPAMDDSLGERVAGLEIPDHSYEFCPRCALVQRSGELTAHLSACSGVT